MLVPKLTAVRGTDMSRPSHHMQWEAVEDVVAQADGVGGLGDGAGERVHRFLHRGRLARSQVLQASRDLHLKLLVKEVIEHAIRCCDKYVAGASDCTELVNTRCDVLKVVARDLIRRV